MDSMAALIIIGITTIGLISGAACLWYVSREPAWDHSPTDEELGQRILEDFILRREDT